MKSRTNPLELGDMKKFDLIVIGSGAGLEVASAAAQSGLKVAIVEKSSMGGTCLNRGCIPSKLLLHSADVVEIIKSANLFGINVEKFSIDFQKIVERVMGIIDSNSSDIRKSLDNTENPKLFASQCSFVGDKILLVGGQKISSNTILIAAGTRPRIPNIKGLSNTNYVTSDEALRLREQPEILTIIGGGYIAAELGHFFGSLGTKINIIHHGKYLLPHEDEEISKKFTEIYSKKYNVYLECTANLVTAKNGNFVVSSKKSGSNRYLDIESDQLLVAAGRIPNSDSLDLPATGVKVNHEGFIKVDETLSTNVDGIFALGDIIGHYQFRHSANLEAQYAFYNMFNPKKKIQIDYGAMPHAIFSSPQVAGVGYKEQELKKKGKIGYHKSVYRYIDTAMGKALEDKEGFVKILVSKENRKILGCHIIGSQASILIHEVLVAMKSGDGTIDNISKTVHVHPALSEVVSRAAISIN
ncbi:MAG TPA: dihydrolipoyl dehydrogenase [Nitrososphaeraceae archaeon]|nr:dihydrolipoyl dehydrogenase [Nitrososphaeraceae archaeon]